MSAVLTSQENGRRSKRDRRSWVQGWRLAAVLFALVLLATVAHVLLLEPAGPWVFYDELGYQKLAQSLGETGRFALFNKPGLSYSPLYPLLLAPLYAFSLTGADAYRWITILNCLLMALAVVPIYMIARYVLSPGRSVLVAALCSLAPLMLFSSLVMSENLAYPVCLCAIWAMIAAVRSGGARRDAVVLLACLAATLARVQFVCLFPAAFCAILVGAVAEQRGFGRRRLLDALREHWLLTAANVVLAVAGLAAVARTDVASLAGRYSNQSAIVAPRPATYAHLVVEHLFGLEFAVAVMPFVGTLIAAYLWARRGTRPGVNAFASVALSVTSILVVLVAYIAYRVSYASDSPGRDMPRIHERYLFYLVPLFVIATVAVSRIPRTVTMVRIGLAAAAVAGLLPALIPFRTVIGPTVGVDSFSLVMFGVDARRVEVTAIDHATLAAVAFASCLGLVYALARPRGAIVWVLLALTFVWMSELERGTLASAGKRAIRVSFSGSRDWVDDSIGGGKAVLVEDPRLRHDFRSLGVVETTFFNLSLTRLYYRCQPILPAEFGEEQVALDSRGRLRDGAALVRARFAVVPAGYGIEGRELARDPRAGLVLVAPRREILTVAAAQRGKWDCPAVNVPVS